MTKKLGLYFLVLSSGKNLGGQNVRVQGAFRHLMWKLSDRFFGPKGSIETKFLKNSCFHRDNRFRPIFRRIIGDEKTSGNNIHGSTSYLDVYCGSYKIICLGPKGLLITQFF